MNRPFLRVVTGSTLTGAWLIVFAALAGQEPTAPPKKSGAPGDKPGTTQTIPVVVAVPPPAKTTSARPDASTRKSKAASTYQTVPNAQLGLGCSSAE